MSTREKVYILIAEGKSNKEIAQELNINLRTVQIYKKEYKAKDETKSENKNEKRKRKKEKAKALIITGESLRQTAKKVKASERTIATLNKEYNLQELQLEYLKNFRNKFIEEIERNKLDRFAMNTRVKEKTVERLESCEKITKDIQDLILLNEKTEQEIFELGRIERLEKLRLEQNNSKYKFINEFMKELEDTTSEELQELINFTKKLKEKRKAIEV